MPWQFQLRHHRDESIGRIADNLLYLFLGIKPTVLRALTLNSLRANLRQLRILLDLDTPTLIVRQMPMQPIDLEQRQHINIFLDILDRHEVATRVQHDAPIAKTRLILDGDRRRLPDDTTHNSRTFNLRWEQLQKRLHAIKQTLRGLSLYDDILGFHIQRIPLISHIQRRIDQ